MSRSLRWPLGGLGRASIAVGLAIAGLVLVGVAVAGPSTPDPTLARAPNGSDTPTTSLSSPEPTPERPTARADHTDLRDQITGLVLPESDPVAVSIPRIRAQSESGRAWARRSRRDGRAGGSCARRLVLPRGRTRRTGAGGHRRSREVERRSWGLSSPGRRQARRSGDRDPEGWKSRRIQRHPGGPILEVGVPEPGGLRRNRPRRAATDHVWGRVRRSQKQVSGQCHRLRQIGGRARASWLMTRRGQPLITSTKGFDVTPESGSSTRSWYRPGRPSST